MESRWFNTVVVLFWMSTMSWLVVAKVVPPFLRGDPPNYSTLYTSRPTEEQPVAWELSLNDKPLGWAASRVVQKGSKVVEVKSRIHFDRIPWEELSPAWVRYVVQTSLQPLDQTPMDVESRLDIDELGHLTRFHSALRIVGLPDAISVSGEVRGSKLRIKVESNEIVPEFETYLPSDAVVSDELSPLAYMSGLRLGQQWTVPVFSPLRPPDSPIQILHAHVEARDPVSWEGEVKGAFRVVYRMDPGSALSSSREPNARLWVCEDGMVVKQEVNVLGSKLVFQRLTSDRAADLIEQVEMEENRRLFHRRRRFRFHEPEEEYFEPPHSSHADP